MTRGETEDQVCLRKWITAGLQIPEVRDLRGDSGYLLCNMIAKYSLAASEYRISVSALERLSRVGINIMATHNRGLFYGKNTPYIYEHAIPVRIVRTELLSRTPDEYIVKTVLKEAGPVAILLRSEDATINNLGFRSSMPSTWIWGDDTFARYHAAGIEISDKVIKFRGAIKR